ncbi:MAG TPA: hypothetical protein VF783_23725, partial [Terriglobales bacterium]
SALMGREKKRGDDSNALLREEVANGRHGTHGEASSNIVGGRGALRYVGKPPRNYLPSGPKAELAATRRPENFVLFPEAPAARYKNVDVARRIALIPT